MLITQVPSIDLPYAKPASLSLRHSFFCLSLSVFFLQHCLDTITLMQRCNEYPQHQHKFKLISILFGFVAAPEPTDSQHKKTIINLSPFTSTMLMRRRHRNLRSFVAYGAIGVTTGRSQNKGCIITYQKHNEPAAAAKKKRNTNDRRLRETVSHTIMNGKSHGGLTERISVYWLAGVRRKYSNFSLT